MFWLFLGVSVLLLAIFLVLPYFTFGDDFKMMKQIDFDLLMLAAAVFGVVTASMSISEEIEGRTAITLMSKPVSRRQFLLGKFVGILLACLAMTALLGLVFQWSLYFKPILDWYGDSTDPLQRQLVPRWSAWRRAGRGRAAAACWCGVALWWADGLACLPGMLLGFCQVMLLVAIASALATRLPMAVNLVACLLLFFLGHLAPVLVQVSHNLQGSHAAEHGGTGSGRWSWCSSWPGCSTPCCRRWSTSTWARPSSATSRCPSASTSATSPRPCWATPSCTPSSPCCSA